MNYLSEHEVLTCFSNLLEIYSQMYDLSVSELFKLEKEGMNNSEDFDKILKKITRFKVKEKRILDKLEISDYYYELLDVIKGMIGNVSSDDNEKALAISERLEFIFERKYTQECLVQEELDNFDFDEYFDDEDIDPDDVVIDIDIDTIDYYTPLQVKFLKHLKAVDSDNDEFLKHKYYESFTYPRLEDELILVRYNPDNLNDIPAELDAKLSNIELEEYNEDVKTAGQSFLEESFIEFFAFACTAGVSKKNLNLLYEQAKFSILGKDTKTIAHYINKYYNNDEQYIITEEALEYTEKLWNELLDEIFNRDDFNEELLNEKGDDSKKTISKLFLEKSYDNLFGVLNSAKEIYDIFNDLYLLDLNGLKNTAGYSERLRRIEDLVREEKQYADNLILAQNEDDIAMEIVDKYLQFSCFLEDEEFNSESNLKYITLKKRVSNLLFNSFVPDISTFKNELVPLIIIENYQLECLQKYEEFIGDLNNIKDHLKFEYIEYASNTNLTEEFVLADGDIKKAIVFDDDYVSKLLEMDIDEYIFDREGLISEHAYDIMNTFSMISNDDVLSSFDTAAIDYQTIALDTAFQYVNKEEFDEFKLSYQASVIEDNSILSKKLHKIFNKKDEKKLEFDRKRH